MRCGCLWLGRVNLSEEDTPMLRTQGQSCHLRVLSDLPWLYVCDPGIPSHLGALFPFVENGVECRQPSQALTPDAGDDEMAFSELSLPLQR